MSIDLYLSIFVSMFLLTCIGTCEYRHVLAHMRRHMNKHVYRHMPTHVQTRVDMCRQEYRGRRMDGWHGEYLEVFERAQEGFMLCDELRQVEEYASANINILDTCVGLSADT